MVGLVAASLLASVAAFLVASVVASQLPVVIYHGLGDNCCNSRVDRFGAALSALLPRGTVIFTIMIGDGPEEDQHRSYFDNANRQVEEVCGKLRGMDDLRDGFDAVGFSQGGLLFRAVVERCGALKVRRLVTLGAPHMGVSASPGCPPPPTRLCKVVDRILAKSAYSSLLRHKFIPAQYYRNPEEYEQYTQHNDFLLDINQETEGVANATYRENLSKLDRLVMYRFTNDTTIYPAESVWFEDGGADGADGDALPASLIHHRLGVDLLKKRNAVQLKWAEGKHMQITRQVIQEIARDLQ